ncbi:hypothetical protein V8D89_004057 [Ganoderma adspersum]
MSEPPIMGVSELHAHSPAFDDECAVYSRGPLSNDSASSLGEKEDDSSSDSYAELSRYDVPELEACFYYFGIRGSRRRGPKLIFRTSKDVFTAPSDPLQEPRLVQLLPVYEHDKLDKNDLWAAIRSKVVGLLDRRNIKHSSVDLVRFTWVEYPDNAADEDDETGETNEDDEEDDDDEDEDTEYVPIAAFHSSNDILDLLKEHGISDVEVAYRESVARALSGLKLFAPALHYDPLLPVIDPVTNALGLPIAGLRTFDRQGTMGFYFKEGDNLYGVTARHVLFPDDEGNDPYSYVASAPKKEVVLMGAGAFTKFLTSIRERINLENHGITILEERIAAATKRSESGGPNAEQAVRELVNFRDELGETRTTIEELDKFLTKMKRQWTQPKDRVIGHVVWAPPIRVSAAPHGYTEDVCVVKLNEKKFSRNFRGNVLDLGPEIDAGKLMHSMHPRPGVPSDFDYPVDRLLELRGLLSAAEMREPSNQDRNGDPVRRDSVEAAVCPDGDNVDTNVVFSHDRWGRFAKAGDSGFVVVDARGRFAALLTGGAGPTECPDIAYASPMHWLWESVKARFPGANLDFGGDNDYIGSSLFPRPFLLTGHPTM